MPHDAVVNFLESRVDLRRAGRSSFVTPHFSSATHARPGVIAWDPGTVGVLGGLVAQDASSDHGGERHLDGDELIVLISGRLTVVLLHEDESVRERIALCENEATLIRQLVWHRIETAGACRYIFFGGGRTEIKRG